MNRAIIISALITSFFSLTTLGSPVNEEEALTRAFGDEDFISIATGQWQPISQAPAVASVITADDIKKMGATDLDQVLETVPGLHVSAAPRGYLSLYTMRGIYSENNPQVLFLINDIPITNLYVGNRGELWGGMPINNIKRIEVIRGPGSAIYGADAFSGTINIITKTSEDINGTEFGARTGSFNTREGWVLHGNEWNNFDIAFSLEFSKTDGQDGIVEADAQTSLDGAFGTNASYTPGPVSLQHTNVESRLDVSNQNWKFRLGYQGRINLGTGAGVAMALDPNGNGDSNRYNADITYTTTVSNDWDITSQASYYDVSSEPDLTLYPAGASFFPLGGTFPEGMIAMPYVYERHTRFNLSAFYHGIEDHNIRMGVGRAHGDMYKVKELKNYTFNVNGFPIYLGSVTDVSDDPNMVFIQPHDRNITYLFLQDEWAIAPDWVLTGGLRYDDYSDFGSTTNPRVALVWQTRYNLTTKLLYGRAFRAPAFNELYNINNPVALGNPDLDPETIDTYEIAFNYQHNEKITSSLNLFRYRMSDILRFAPPTFTAQNTGVIHGHGLELETKYIVNSEFQLHGNYAIQNSTEDETDSDVANAPQHLLYLGAEWQPAQKWMLNTQLHWVADRARDQSDPRSNIDNYTLVNVSLRYRPTAHPWEVALTVNNIFDESAYEPSPRLDALNQPLIPGDLPLAERNLILEGQYHFE